MPRRSSKSIANISSQTNVSFLDENSNDKDISLLQSKNVLATEGFYYTQILWTDPNRQKQTIKGKFVDNMRLWYSNEKEG